MIWGNHYPLRFSPKVTHVAFRTSPAIRNRPFVIRGRRWTVFFVSNGDNCKTVFNNVIAATFCLEKNCRGQLYMNSLYKMYIASLSASLKVEQAYEDVWKWNYRKKQHFEMFLFIPQISIDFSVVSTISVPRGCTTLMQRSLTQMICWKSLHVCVILNCMPKSRVGVGMSLYHYHFWNLGLMHVVCSESLESQYYYVSSREESVQNLSKYAC